MSLLYVNKEKVGPISDSNMRTKAEQRDIEPMSEYL